MVDANKTKRPYALKEVKRLCRECGFTAWILKCSFAEGQKK